MEKRLYKDQQHKMIGGVCAGLSEYFNIDVTLIRVLFFLSLVLHVVLHGSGFVLYVILWICLPKKPYVFGTPDVDYRVPTDPFGNTASQATFTTYTGVPKTRSNAGVIIGTVLILIGGICLADQFDIIPDFDFGNLWPLVFVAVGCALIFTRGSKKPWEHDNWNDLSKNEQAADPEVKNNETNINDNHPIA